MLAGTAQLGDAEPLARIAGHATHSRHPSEFTIAPVGAIDKLLTRLGWSVDDVDLFEVNEAFSGSTVSILIYFIQLFIIQIYALVTFTAHFLKSVSLDIGQVASRISLLTRRPASKNGIKS